MKGRNIGKSKTINSELAEELYIRMNIIYGDTYWRYVSSSQLIQNIKAIQIKIPTRKI